MTTFNEKSVSEQITCETDTSNIYYVYLASCVNGTLYVGYTKNIEKRIAAHNAGHGGRYTRINRPLTLVAFWSLNNRVAAIKKERLIKRLQTEQKLQLAELTADYYLGCP